MYRRPIFSRILQVIKTNGYYSNPCIHRLNVKLSNVREQGTLAMDDGYIKKFMNAVGWMDRSRTVCNYLVSFPALLKYIQSDVRLKLTGYFLYECVPDKISYKEWFERLELPDTFASWFIITELHVWLLMVRYMTEDIVNPNLEKKKYIKGDGHFVRNCIVEALWSDVANRIKLLEGANPSLARKQVSELSEQFQAALVAYDEGLSDDRVMAAAIWRRFYSLSEIKAEHVESIVHFIRHQISELDKIPSESLKWKPVINWLSILNH